MPSETTGRVRGAECIPLSEPDLRGNESKYVQECLDTSWVSSAGAYVETFEQMVARDVGVPHAVAMVSGTAALHVGLRVVGVEPDDEVLVPALTFIAPANAVRYLGAWPVFMDVDPEFWQLDVDKVARFLDEQCGWHQGRLRNRTTGRRVRAIMPVHLLGHPCPIGQVLELARRYELKVVADATEALGAQCRSSTTGGWAAAAAFGDVACLSFNGNKIITTGGGGMLLTTEGRLAATARYLSTQAKDDPVECVHGDIGYNYRLTNIQAAIGVGQMERLPEFIKTKRQIARNYEHAFRSIRGVTPMREAPWAFSTFWLYTIQVEGARFGMESRALRAELAGQGIQCRPVWQPLHRSRPHATAQAYAVEVADRCYREGLSLPCSVSLTTDQQARVIATIRGAGGLGSQ